MRTTVREDKQVKAFLASDSQSTRPDSATVSIERRQVLRDLKTCGDAEALG
jgi:hypothetical protein